MTGKCQKAAYTVKNPQGQSFTLILKGRNKWAMDELISAGKQGCTPSNHPAPRWSAYIHNLRTYGVAIKTITGQHSDTFSGHHARYLLLAEAAVVLIGGA